MNANLSANSSHQKHFTEQQHVFVSGTLAYFLQKPDVNKKQATSACVIGLTRFICSVF